MDIWLGNAYLSLLQASFAEGDFAEAIKWGRLAIQMQSAAPIRRALMVACCAFTDDLKESHIHVRELAEFSPDFIPNVLSGSLLLYKHIEHNALFVEGLKKSGAPFSINR